VGPRTLLAKAQSDKQRLPRLLRFTYLDALSLLIYEGDLRGAFDNAYRAWAALLALIAAETRVPRILSAPDNASLDEARLLADAIYAPKPEHGDRLARIVAEELGVPGDGVEVLRGQFLADRLRLYFHYHAPELSGLSGEGDAEAALVEFMETLRKLAEKKAGIRLPPP